MARLCAAPNWDKFQVFMNAVRVALLNFAVRFLKIVKLGKEGRT